MIKKLPKFAVEHPFLMIPIFLLLIAGGIIVYHQLYLELQPYLENPTVGVIVTYPGISAQDMEDYFARPIEQKMGVISNHTFIRSTSEDGRTEVIIGFPYGSDLNNEKLQVQTLLTNMLNELPISKTNTTNPWVVHVANDNVPVLKLMVWRDGWDDVRTRSFIDNALRDRLEGLPGVQAIVPFGGKRREVRVSVDRNKLTAYNLGLMDIRNALAQQDISQGAGELKTPHQDIVVRATARFLDPAKLMGLPIGTFKNRTIYLRDVGTVKDTYAETTSGFLYNGKPGILISLVKTPKAGDEQPINAVLHRMDEFVQYYPGLHYAVAYDRMPFLQRIIRNAWREMFLAFVIVALIVLAFLNQIRPVSIVLVTLPAAVSAGFMFWWPFGFTVNTPTLMALTFIIGRLVDDSVVMMEVIDRHLRMGKSAKQAAIDGAQEISNAILAVGFTSYVALTPALFLGGSMGTGFRGMTAPMIFAAAFSTFFTLTLDPMLRAYILKPPAAGKVSLTDRIDAVIRVIFAPAQWLWKKVEWANLTGLHFALDHRMAAVFLAAASIWAGYSIWPTLGWEGMPLQDTGQAVGQVFTWPGASFQDTEKAAAKVSKLLLENPEVTKVATQVGVEPSFGTYFSGYGVPTINEANYTITMTSTDRRTCQFYNRWADHLPLLHYIFQPCRDRSGRNIWQILDTTQAEALRTVPGIRAVWFMEMGATPFNTSRAPVEAIIKGDNLKTLANIGDQAVDVANRTPGLYQPFESWTLTQPQYHLVIDRERARELGLTPLQIAMQSYYALHGGMSEEFFMPRSGNRHMRLIIRYKKSQRMTKNDLEECILTTPGGQHVPLKEVATVEMRRGTDTVYKEDLQYAMSILAQYREVGLKMATAGLIMGVKTTVNLPQGYTVEPKGVMLEMLDNIYRLYDGMYVVVFLLFVMLLMQSRSFVATLAVMFDAPLEWMGAIYFLKVRHFFWSPPVMWGLMLATVMVMATGIFLTDKIEELRKAGLDRKRAILLAGPIRLRPVLMTALTTAGAFIPPMFAPPTGMDRFRPIATGIVGALVSSTILGLILVPVFYSVLDDIAKYLKWAFTKVWEKEPAPVAEALPAEVIWETNYIFQITGRSRFAPRLPGAGSEEAVPALVLNNALQNHFVTEPGS